MAHQLSSNQLYGGGYDQRINGTIQLDRVKGHTPFGYYDNDPEFIKASFNMPKTHHLFYECYQPLYNALKNFVNPKIKTMIEAGNISGSFLIIILEN